jgi:AraC family transcriptional regulator
MQQNYSEADISQAGGIISKSLFVSDFYEIKQMDYCLTPAKKTATGLNDSLCMVYVKAGFFSIDYFKKAYDMHSGYILLDKPGFEYRIRPADGTCTIFNFTADFLKQYLAEVNLSHASFFCNRNILSAALRVTPETDYLYYLLLAKLNTAAKLEMDSLVIELFERVTGLITNIRQHQGLVISSKANRLTAIETAKEYMNKNFASDISLQEIAVNSCISPFHFSRLFKKATSFSPCHYLQHIRLKHGEMLLKNEKLQVADIAYASGFGSAAYFASAFKQVYKINPIQYRRLAISG